MGKFRLRATYGTKDNVETNQRIRRSTPDDPQKQTEKTEGERKHEAT